MSHYLDTKRRILFMIASIKYIRLVMTNNKMITKDEIDVFVAEAIEMIIGDNMADTDKVILAKDIASNHLIIKDNLTSNDKVNLITQYKASINVNEIIDFKNTVSLGNVSPKYIEAKGDLESNAITNLVKSIPDDLKIKGTFETLDLVEFSVAYPILIKIYDELALKENIKLNNITSNHIKGIGNISLSDSIKLIVEHLVLLPLQIRDSFCIYNKILELNIANSANISIELNKVINDSINVKDDIADNIEHYGVISFDDYVNLGRYRYTLLKDIENLDIETYYDELISSTILTQI